MRPRLYLAASPGQRGRRRALQNALQRPFARFELREGLACDAIDGREEAKGREDDGPGTQEAERSNGRADAKKQHGQSDAKGRKGPKIRVSWLCPISVTWGNNIGECNTYLKSITKSRE